MSRKTNKKTLRLGREAIRTLTALDLPFVVGGARTCTALTRSKVESECVTRCNDCP